MGKSIVRKQKCQIIELRKKNSIEQRCFMSLLLHLFVNPMQCSPVFFKDCSCSFSVFYI